MDAFMLDCMDVEKMRYAGALGSDFPLPPTLPFTTKMAREAGITDRQLRELVRLGLLRRPLKGLYVADDVTDSLELRVACLKLVVPPMRLSSTATQAGYMAPR